MRRIVVACARRRVAVRLPAAARKLAAIVAIVVPPTIASADEHKPLTLKCVGEIAFGQSPSAEASVSFETTVPFGEGSFLALTDPETGKVEELLYDMEVFRDQFRSNMVGKLRLSGGIWSSDRHACPESQTGEQWPP